MAHPFRQCPGWRCIEVYGGVSGGQEDSSINSRRETRGPRWGVGGIAEGQGRGVGGIAGVGVGGRPRWITFVSPTSLHRSIYYLSRFLSIEGEQKNENECLP